MGKERYREFCELNIDTSCLGLAHGEIEQYFCTPVGAAVIGWDNGIHYCFISGFGEMVFAVNPDSCCEHYVYPLANNFTDFLRLILAVKGTNTIQQMILWNQQQYEDFVHSPEEIEYASKKEVTDTLAKLQNLLGVTAMENPFEYVKSLQAQFPYDRIMFSDEYYDATGRERP